MIWTVALKSEIFDRLSDDEFVDFCLAHTHLQIERTAEGEILIDMPNYSKTGEKSGELFYQLTAWNKKSKKGKTFDSSSGFFLPSTAMRSPDASWISYTRWNQLSQEQQAKFAHICPDFVIELKSETDDLKTLQKKMREDWLENGCLLAWLIDPETETSYIYRADRSETIVNGFDKTLSGENVLDGFVLELIELKNL